MNIQLQFTDITGSIIKLPSQQIVKIVCGNDGIGSLTLVRMKSGQNYWVKESISQVYCILLTALKRIEMGIVKEVETITLIPEYQLVEDRLKNII